MALVASSVAFGVVSAGGRDATAAPPDPTSLSLDLVGQARAAGVDAPDPRSVTFELQPDPNAPSDPVISRKVARYQATPAPTALPTPIAPPPPPPDPTPPPPPPPPKPAPVVGSGMLLWPVPGGVITTYYSSAHLAIDIAASAGTTVLASDAGVVTWAGWRNNGGGNVIQIDHGNGVQTVYNHLGSIWVSVGQSVVRGEGIGAVGCTGTCTGPHVHFEVIVNGVIVNPLRYL